MLTFLFLINQFLVLLLQIFLFLFLWQLININPVFNQNNLKIYILIIFKTHSVQFSSVAQSCPTLCNPMNCSMPGMPPCLSPTSESTKTHVHQVVSYGSSYSIILATKNSTNLIRVCLNYKEMFLCNVFLK